MYKPESGIYWNSAVVKVFVCDYSNIVVHEDAKLNRAFNCHNCPYHVYVY